MGWKLAGMIGCLSILFLACVLVVVIEEDLIQNMSYQNVLDTIPQDSMSIVRQSIPAQGRELMNDKTEIHTDALSTKLPLEYREENSPATREKDYKPKRQVKNDLTEETQANNDNVSTPYKEQSSTKDAFNFKAEEPGPVQHRKTKGVKTILWYDTHGQSMVGHSHLFKMSECEYNNCKMKYLITRFKPQLSRPRKPFDADAVIVQSRAMFSLSPPPRRDRNQVFVMAIRDAFPRLKGDVNNRVAKQWTSLFNYTMTYRFDSDFMYPYSTIVRTNKDQIRVKNYENIFKEKSREALWFVSHCKTASKRENYVKELRKELNVDIYGGCGKKPPCPKGSHSCFNDLAKKYKYYLSFENTLYKDYVTEKVFGWFEQNIITVVRGGSDYSQILPPGTYINAADFPSARHLGRYLKSLASNKSEYIAYLQRKNQYHKTNKLESAKKANCKLCEYLNTPDLHRKSYDDIRKWWLQNWRN